jgi:hypothetical protein
LGENSPNPVTLVGKAQFSLSLLRTVIV